MPWALMCLVAIAFSCLLPMEMMAQRIQQPLGRGVVAVYGTSNGSAGVEITWRRLAQEPEDARYNVYVSKTKEGGYTKLNASPLANTNYATTLTKVPYNSYVAVTILNGGVESELSKPFLFKNNGLRNIYMEIRYTKSPLDASHYDTKFVWPCDLNGDGEYDYVVDRNPTDGTDNHFLEAYLADGTYLWTVDLGPNELSSTGQDDQICAYDIDCDGFGEVIVQTSDGTRFWDKAANTWGKYLNHSDNPDTDGDGIINYNTHATRNAPKFMTVINGMTGEEKASVEQQYDNAYNRTNRATLMGEEYFRHTGHVGVFYHDGVHPGVVMEWHTRTTAGAHQYRNSAFAYDFDANGKATQWRQIFMEHVGGAEFHMIRIFDADGDGKDEMSSGAYCMDHDGKTLYNTGISHGDRHRTSDIDPERPGLETFSIQQNAPDMLGQILFDAGTGESIKKWYLSAVGDVGRGECLDLDQSHLGWEMFSTMDGYQVYDAKGNKIDGMTGYFPTEGIWWDGALDRERVDSPDGNGYNAMIVDYKNGRYIEMAKESGWTINSSNGKRGKYWGDIMGDWREELVLSRIIDGVNVGIVGFTTDFSTTVNNIYCLQEDPHYRMDCTTRGYYQAPDPGFYLGYDMPRPQLPPCMVANDTTDVFGISLGDATITPRSGVKTVYAMPVKGQTLIYNDGESNAGRTIWKSQQGTLVVDKVNPADNIIISEGTVLLNNVSAGKVDLRARGTLSGSGTVDAISVEGALNYEGCRIMPQPLITINSNLSISRKTYVEIDLEKSAYVVVNGNMTVTKPLIFTISNENPQPGEYKLIECKGTLSALSTQLSVRGLVGISYNIVNKENALWLVINDQREASDGVVWNATDNTKWDYQTENFLLGGRKTSFVAGDSVIFNDAATTTSISLSELIPVGSVTFENNTKNYTLAGAGGISGTGDLVVKGQGKVTLSITKSDYTGKTIIESGTVTVKELADGGIPSSIGAASTTPENLQIGKATLIINNTNTSTDRGIVLNDTATIQVASGVASLKGLIRGTGVLRKTGAGQLNITRAGINMWSGTILSAGTLAMGAWNTTFGMATSPIEVTGNSTITMFDANSTSTVPSVQNAITINDGVTLTFHAGSRCSIKGSLLGKGTYKINFPYVRGDVSTDVSKFEGTYQVTTSNCRFIQAMDFSKATLQLDANSYAAGFKSGSGTETAYSNKIGTLTGTGTLGTGTWNISRLLIDYKPSINGVTTSCVTINGTAVLNNAVIDLRTTSALAIPDNAEITVLKGSGTRTVKGTLTILPERPKEGWVWDTSRLASDGVITIKQDTGDYIHEVEADYSKRFNVFNIAGQRIRETQNVRNEKGANGIIIVNGKKRNTTK